MSMSKYFHTKIPGFTLTELIITFGLISLIITLSFGTLFLLSKMTMRSEIDQLYATCLYAQRCAQMMNKPQIILIDTEKNSYSYNNFTHYVSPSVSFGVI